MGTGWGPWAEAQHKIRFALGVSVRAGRERASPRAPTGGELERGLKGKSRLQELGRGNFCHGHWLSGLVPDSASGYFYFKRQS